METQVETKNTQSPVPVTADDKPATKMRRVRPEYRSFQVEGGWRLEIDLPGIDRDTLALDVEKLTLSLKAQRHHKLTDGYQLVKGDDQSISYELALQIGSDIDAEQITAAYEHGVLAVNLPTKPERRPRSIEVK